MQNLVAFELHVMHGGDSVDVPNSLHAGAPDFKGMDSKELVPVTQVKYQYMRIHII